LDSEDGETRYCREPSHDLTPEALFERQWALTLLDSVLIRLREEHAMKGQTLLFDRLKAFLTGDQDRESYEQTATGLNMSCGAVKTAVHRLRARYAQLVREEVAATLDSPGEIEGELRFLLTALARG
jgi:RNA polymerase sigma-70 factor (ECF subfamily)